MENVFDFNKQTIEYLLTEILNKPSVATTNTVTKYFNDITSLQNYIINWQDTHGGWEIPFKIVKCRVMTVSSEQSLVFLCDIDGIEIALNFSNYTQTDVNLTCAPEIEMTNIHLIRFKEVTIDTCLGVYLEHVV